MRMFVRVLLLMEVLEGHAYSLAPFLPRTRGLGPLVMCSVETAEPSSLKMKELKAELDERGVAWRGVAFEKDELVRLLVDARTQPPPSEPEAPATEPEPTASEPEATANEQAPPPSPPAEDTDSAAQEEGAYQAAYETA
jgi:hypothetical protein